MSVDVRNSKLLCDNKPSLDEFPRFARKMEAERKENCIMVQGNPTVLYVLDF